MAYTMVRSRVELIIRCNSTQHSLSHCPQRADPKNPTPYATCFICLGTGHLSALCPQNTKGVYVKGGSCKVCGSVQHRANDCPDDKREKRRKFTDNDDNDIVADAGDVGADEDDFMIKAREEIKAAALAASIKEKEKGKKKKHAPNNNGPREKYANFKAQHQEDGEGLLAEIAPPAPAPTPAPARAERVEASVTLKPAVVAEVKPVQAPVKRTKPKVVKF
jgi:zinc finger CCHC domain-containing protein 9